MEEEEALGAEELGVAAGELTADSEVMFVVGGTLGLGDFGVIGSIGGGGGAWLGLEPGPWLGP